MLSTETILLECEYFPCIHWYRNFLQHENPFLEHCEYFERASLRNRCYIAGPQGILTLSIPLLGGRNQKTLMKDVKVSYNEAWQELHWKTLASCYNRSPYFEFVADDLLAFFKTKYQYLIELNLASVQLIQRCLRIKKNIQFSTSFDPEKYTKNLRLQINAHNYHHFANDLNYLQVFQSKNGFHPNLSMLDFIFCEGPSLTPLLYADKKN
jgi:WbqC-like protein family